MLQTLTLSITIILLSFEKAKLERDCNEKMLNDVYVLDKLKTEFFANISHELRTPINILFSSVKLFELYTENNSKYDEKKISEYLKVMRQNSCRLIKLVEDTTMSVIDFAKSKNIELIFDTEFEEKIISCDAEKIERIILNLLSNAVKFTKPFGKIEVLVKSLVEMHGGHK